MAKKKTGKKRGRPPKKKQQPEIKSYPKAGQKVTGVEQEIDRQFAAAGEQHPYPKAAPGTTEQQPIEAQGDQISIGNQKDLIKQAISLPFNYWSITQDQKKLKLEDSEAEMIATPADTLLTYYLPGMNKIYLAWIAFATAVVTITGTRLALVAELRKQRQGNPTITKASSSSEPGDKGLKTGPAGNPAPSTPGLGPSGFPTEINIENE